MKTLHSIRPPLSDIVLAALWMHRADAFRKPPIEVIITGNIIRYNNVTKTKFCVSYNGHIDSWTRAGKPKCPKNAYLITFRAEDGSNL